MSEGQGFLIIGWSLALACFAAPGVYNVLVAVGLIAQTCIGNICH